MSFNKTDPLDITDMGNYIIQYHIHFHCLLSCKGTCTISHYSVLPGFCVCGLAFGCNLQKPARWLQYVSCCITTQGVCMFRYQTIRQTRQVLRMKVTVMATVVTTWMSEQGQQQERPSETGSSMSVFKGNADYLTHVCNIHIYQQLYHCANSFLLLYDMLS